MRVRDGHPPASRVGRSTVESRRARRCVGRALDHIRRRSDGGSGRVRVTIRFDGASQDADER